MLARKLKSHNESSIRKTFHPIKLQNTLVLGVGRYWSLARTGHSQAEFCSSAFLLQGHIWGIKGPLASRCSSFSLSHCILSFLENRSRMLASVFFLQMQLDCFFIAEVWVLDTYIDTSVPVSSCFAIHFEYVESVWKKKNRTAHENHMQASGSSLEVGVIRGVTTQSN